MRWESFEPFMPVCGRARTSSHCVPLSSDIVLWHCLYTVSFRSSLAVLATSIVALATHCHFCWHFILHRCLRRERFEPFYPVCGPERRRSFDYGRTYTGSGHSSFLARCPCLLVPCFLLGSSILFRLFLLPLAMLLTDGFSWPPRSVDACMLPISLGFVWFRSLVSFRGCLSLDLHPCSCLFMMHPIVMSWPQCPFLCRTTFDF